MATSRFPSTILAAHVRKSAQASLSDVDAQLEISNRLGYITEDLYKDVEAKMSEVQMLLNGLSRRLRSESAT